ncbi:MAG: 30S ribosomal protein S6 [bacterium]|nr:30S ribosomal protein S6 [bacterium]
MTSPASRLYEMLYIIDAGIGETDVKSVENDVKKIISETGGELTKENIWGRRQLAFPIKKKTEGFYIDLEFKATPATPKELRELFHTRTSVLRYMIMQVPKAKLIQEKRDAERLKKRMEEAEREKAAAAAAAAKAAQEQAEKEAAEAKAAQEAEASAEESQASADTAAVETPAPAETTENAE